MELKPTDAKLTDVKPPDNLPEIQGENVAQSFEDADTHLSESHDEAEDIAEHSADLASEQIVDQSVGDNSQFVEVSSESSKASPAPDASSPVLNSIANRAASFDSATNAVPISVSPATQAVKEESSGSPMSISSSPVSNIQSPTNAQRPGERLRQARLLQQRDLKTIATELNIPERLLAAIEADEYKSLPEPTFIRGYLRSYARALGISSDVLIAQFNEIYTSATGLASNHSLENSPLQQLAKLQTKQRKSRGWIIWVIVIPVLIVLVVLALRPLVKRVMSSPTGDRETHSVVLSDNTAPSASAASTTTVPLATSAAPISATPTAAASSSDQLVLIFNQASEALIQDSTGKTLASGEQSAGQTLTLTGVSPFSITLANADGVGLSLNGEKVDLKPYTVQGHASFRLSR